MAYCLAHFYDIIFLINKDEFVRQEVDKGVAQQCRPSSLPDEIVAQGNTVDGVTQYPPSSMISIADSLRNVNFFEESFDKYLPINIISRRLRALTSPFFYVNTFDFSIS